MASVYISELLHIYKLSRTLRSANQNLLVTSRSNTATYRDLLGILDLCPKTVGFPSIPTSSPGRFSWLWRWGAPPLKPGESALGTRLLPPLTIRGALSPNWKKIFFKPRFIDFTSCTGSVFMIFSFYIYGLLLVLVFFYQLFWTQACPEGIGTNGTHRSHARYHPYPIPQPLEVGHTTEVFVLYVYSFRTVVLVLLSPTWTDWKGCETGPTVFGPYRRRVQSLTICRFHYKGSTFFSII